ncbi:MAG TPA: FAD-dependent oxidoreductase [Steroidobacteraceae bacterium]|nr:FAD-dependent oxidoreductase [Steroidobacteraceae bacterium]
MNSHARVAVIGGGVVGASVLYHLTQLGWRDVMLLERAELTAGSTWHAAGGVHTLNGDSNVAALQAYTIELYREIERVSGVSCGLHRTGCIYLAVTENEAQFFESEEAKARHLNVGLHFIDLDEVRERNPLIDISHYRAAMFDPNDGHVDPSGVTHAYAKAARDAGAQIHRHTPVTAIRRLRSGEWELSTPAGTVRAEYIVNAAGLWAREVGRLLQVELPVIPMEHQYLITNEIPELAALSREIPAAVDFDGAVYLRQEAKGLLVGTYEQDCRHWAVDGTPADFGVELLPPDIDRIVAPLDKMMQRMPAMRGAGVKRIVNGGMVFSPDGNPIIGPLPGHDRAFMAAGCMAGFSQGGGIGLAVARWIVEGEPGMDVFAMDVSRFGDFANSAYVRTKTRENYQRRFILPCWNEELPAARPLRTSPIYDRLVQAGGVFGVAAAHEVPLWFAPTPAQAHERPSFHRSSAFEHVARECRAVREAVGIWDTSSYCKLEVSGAGAESWLDGILANSLPLETGRIVLSPLLTPRGRILGEVTVARIEPDRFLLFGSPSAESYYLRWLRQRLPELAQVSIRSRTRELCGLSITGPRARELLERVATGDVSDSGLPFLCARSLSVGLASALVLRLSFTGELGYEIYVAADEQRHVFASLCEAGAPLGLRNFGLRALNALRLEKGYGAWGREYTSDATPDEAGLSRFVRVEKGDFIGREAVIESRREPPKRRLSLLAIDSSDPDPTGGEPVYLDGKPVARLTSAAYVPGIGRALGFAYLPSGHAPDAEAVVQVLSRRLPARILPEAPYDPRGARLRG